MSFFPYFSKHSAGSHDLRALYNISLIIISIIIINAASLVQSGIIVTGVSLGRLSVCLSSVLWKNNACDLDVVWHGMSDGARDRHAVGFGDW